MNRINAIGEHGQSVWYDYIQRSMIWTGQLHQMIQEDGLKGLTSNPAIFEKAISGSADYMPALTSLFRKGAGVTEAFEQVAMTDIRMAADVFRPVFDQTKGIDGYVSFEVSPHLAYDTETTVLEAIRLKESIGRENLMMKVPATDEGIPAIEMLISMGINVNVTLLFSVEKYIEVAHAYIRGLTRFAEEGGDPSRVASVASFFVSRIDSAVDSKLNALIENSTDKDEASSLRALLGKTAVANAKRAYHAFEETFASKDWKSLEKKGARVQRLLWASTSAKDPAYRDVVYVEELIGKDTVNTVPEATYKAFNDHGVAEAKITQGLDNAEEVLRQLEDKNISLANITAELLEQGVSLFSEAFDRLIATVAERRSDYLSNILTATSYSLSDEARSEIGGLARKMEQQDFGERFFDRDGSLWTEDEKEQEEIESFMGWLDAADKMDEYLESIADLQDELDYENIQHVVLLGMGGSSLAAEVFAKTFSGQHIGPELIVLDTTVPEQVKSVLSKVEPEQTLFLVASKSGTTAEAMALEKIFFAKAAPDRFMAITDPESPLEDLAHDRGYRGAFLGDPEIGGRYSALSPFGMIPAAAIGLDVAELVERAQLAARSCAPDVPVDLNPGLYLGTVLGQLGTKGQNKVTLVADGPLVHFLPWLEQLISESSGKSGVGLVPIVGEPLFAPGEYGEDRVFVHFSTAEYASRENEEALKKLGAAGFPVIQVTLPELADITQEMYRWCVATATACAILGVNPFDQPNVAKTKEHTHRLLSEFEKTGNLPAIQETCLAKEGPLSLFGKSESKQETQPLGQALAQELCSDSPSGYVAINAFCAATTENLSLLEELRSKVRAITKRATTLGIGPRFLHSTGQLHKGGPSSLTVLHLTAEDGEDVDVPGAKFSLSTLKDAQAAGDLEALRDAGRKALHVDLGKDVGSGIRALISALPS